MFSNIDICVCAQSLNRVWLFAALWTIACQDPLSMEFSKQEYWIGSLFTPPGYLPNPVTESTCLISPALAGRFFTPAPPQFSSLQSLSKSESWQPHGLQQTRFPCPSPTPRPCSNLHPLSWWCHPSTSSSVIPFSSWFQSFPASRSFPRDS